MIDKALDDLPAQGEPSGRMSSSSVLVSHLWCSLRRSPTFSPVYNDIFRTSQGIFGFPVCSQLSFSPNQSHLDLAVQYFVCVFPGLKDFFSGENQPAKGPLHPKAPECLPRLKCYPSF